MQWCDGLFTLTIAFVLGFAAHNVTAAEAAAGDLTETLIQHSQIMCPNYASEAARDAAVAVRSAVGDEVFGIFVRNQYTLCPISRLNGKPKAVWYSRYGAVGYDRDADPQAVVRAVGPVIKEFAKKKQGPEGNASFDENGKQLTHQVVPMFEPQCLKIFRQCY